MADVKVLQVYRTYYPDPPGGLQEAIRQIALATQGLGIETRIFTLSPQPQPARIARPEALVVRSRSFAAPASCDLGFIDALQQFRRLVAWADIVHYQFPWPFADMLHFAGRVAKPCVLTYQSDVINKGPLATVYRPLMLAMLRRMDAIVTTSPAYARTSDVLRAHVDPARIRVIPLGIDEASYAGCRAAAETIDVASKYGIEPGRYFLFVGVLRPYKGLCYLVEAGRLSGLPIVIVGRGREGAALRELAAGHDNIRFLGQVSDAEKMALVAQCRAAVLPSHLRSEAFGMVLVEAAMCGRPLVSCEIGTGTSFVNLDSVSGIVVPPADPVHLAAALQQIAADDALAERCGAGARRRYEEMFSGGALGQAYATLYRELKAVQFSGRPPELDQTTDSDPE